MTTNDERLLQLIRLDRWLQRRNPRRLWAETSALAIGFACLADVLAVLSLEWFPPDPAYPMVCDLAWCLDTTGLLPWPVVWGWVAGVVLIISVKFANVLKSGISRRTLTDKSYSKSQGRDIDIE
jgi:hypothetical protein